MNLQPQSISSEAEDTKRAIIEVEALSIAYDTVEALSDVTMTINSHEVTALIGASGCGKTTLLRAINRMNDLQANCRITNGRIIFNGSDIHSPQTDVVRLRKQIGMVFQRSNPFPKSIYENVVYGLRIQGIRRKVILDAAVREALQSVALWEEVKNRLYENALLLSGGQQQRLCIARALAVKPEILLMDEPCSALDPVATAKIEELIHQLKAKYTIIVVTHNMQQAARVSDRTAFFNLGKLIECDDTDTIFMNPRQASTEAYVSGRFG